MLVGRLGNDDDHLVVANGRDRARRPVRKEVVDRGGDPVPESRGRPGGPRRPGGLERDRQDPVLAGGVVAEVPGPPCHLAVVAPAADQQPLEQVVPDLPGRRGHDPLPAEDHAADRRGVLGDQQAHVVVLAVAAERHQVWGTSSPTRIGATMTPPAGGPAPRIPPAIALAASPTSGSRSDLRVCAALLSTAASRGLARYARTSSATSSPASAEAAARTSSPRLTTATVDVVRSASSRATVDTSASCSVSPVRCW